jgi:hypothetical protein
MNIIKFILFNIILFSFIGSAQAELLWNWKIDNPIQTVNLTDTISITGTITNNVTSTGSLTFEQITGQVNPISYLFEQGDFTPDKFITDAGPIGQLDFLSQFSGLQIAPGQSFTFALYSFIPVGGSVNLGVYRNSFNGLYLSSTSSGFIQGGGIQVTVVPEPSSTALIILGLILLVGYSRKIRQA